jgi:hypothetical protein
LRTGSALHGSLDLTRDQAGLKRARALKSLLDAVVATLEAEDLPDAVPEEPETKMLEPCRAGRRPLADEEFRVRVSGPPGRGKAAPGVGPRAPARPASTLHAGRTHMAREFIYHMRGLTKTYVRPA